MNRHTPIKKTWMVSKNIKKVFIIIYYQKNANQKNNKILSHTSENGTHEKD